MSKKPILNKIFRNIFNILPVAFFIIFILILFFSRNELTLDTILSYTPKNLFLAFLFLMLAYGIKSISIVFPLMMLQLTSGILFSPVLAILVNISGSIVCLSIPYFIGKQSRVSLTSSIFKNNPAIKEILTFQNNNDWFFTYLLRLLGIFPCDIVSIYLGKLQIPYHRYIFSSVFGMLPSIICTTIMGVAVEDPLSPAFILSASINITLSICSYIVYRILKKRALPAPILKDNGDNKIRDPLI